MSESMPRLDLERYSSLVRKVGSECTFLEIISDFLVVGSKEGRVVCWNLTNGSKIWSLDFDGPCVQCDVLGMSIFFTESNMVHSIDIESGEVLWTLKLEGSSDLIKVDGENLWVTSSVYNFEIQDFSEGSIWKISTDGRILRTWSTVGRAWSVSCLEGVSYFGLSRPKCGYAKIVEDKIEYFSLKNGAPITIGIDDGVDRIFFGHSDGKITQLGIKEELLFQRSESSVTAIDYENGLVAGMESGVIFSGEEFGSWTVNLEMPIESIAIGPSLVIDEMGLWVTCGSEECEVSLLNIGNGVRELVIPHTSRIESVCSSGRVICFGDWDGDVFVIEEEVLRRRFLDSEEVYLERKDEAVIRRKIRELRRG